MAGNVHHWLHPDVLVAMSSAARRFIDTRRAQLKYLVETHSTVKALLDQHKVEQDPDRRAALKDSLDNL